MFVHVCLLHGSKDPDVVIVVVTFKPCKFLMEMSVQVFLVCDAKGNSSVFSQHACNLHMDAWDIRQIHIHLHV